MSASEFVISCKTYSESIVELISSGSSIWLVSFGDPAVKILKNDNFYYDICNKNVSLAIKNPKFALDEPRIVSSKKENIEWKNISDIDGDGHLSIDSRVFNIGEKKYCYVVFSYTSFFVKKDGSYIKPPSELIKMYKKHTNRLKRICSNKFIGKLRRVYIENIILEENANWLDSIRLNSGIV